MNYNLTDNQKNLVKWIVNQIHDGKLSEEFVVVWLPDGGEISDYRGKHPPITKGALEALTAAELLICIPSYETRLISGVAHPKQRQVEVGRECVLTGRAYEAVDSDFNASYPVQRLEVTMRDYLAADQFQQKYPKAYQKWAEAEVLLWTGDLRQLTTIGHLCREAMQDFITALIDKHQPPNVATDPTHTVDRVRAVLNLRAEQLGGTERQFFDALLSYWGTAWDLIQRQEHGSQREKEPLIWEDGRLVVFQTMIVMFEIDRALSHTWTDFRLGLGAWKGTNNWVPQIDPDRGVKLVDTDSLRKVLYIEQPRFVNGTIDCEVYLEQGALFDIAFRGSLAKQEFYMARLDSRSSGQDAWDAILFKEQKGHWVFCNKGERRYHSPSERLLRMRVQVDGQRIELYRDNQLVHWIDDAEIKGDEMGLFAEVANVYVKRIRIAPKT